MMRSRTEIAFWLSGLLLALAACDISLGSSDGGEEGIDIIVTGRVVDAQTGEGLEGARVTALVLGEEENAILGAPTQTLCESEDTCGTFTLAGLNIDVRKDKYKLLVERDGYRENDDTTLFALLPGTVQMGRIRLQKNRGATTARVQSTAVDGFEADAPLEGARVKIRRTMEDSAPVCEVETGPDGDYICEGIPFGEYQLSLELEGYVTIQSTLLVDERDVRLFPHRLYAAGFENDLTVVLEWVTPEGYVADLDLKVDIADTAGGVYRTPLLGLEGFEHARPRDFSQRMVGFADDTPYWPFDPEDRASVDYQDCTYPPLEEVDDLDNCADLDEDRDSFFVQLRRDTRGDGEKNEPEVVSFFGDAIPFGAENEIDLDRAYAYRNPEGQLRYPVAMAAVMVDSEYVDTEGLEAGGAPQLPLTSVGPTVSVLTGEQEIGFFALNNLDLPIGETLDRWIPFYIEYGLTEDEEVYFEVHPSGFVEMTATRRTWVYAYEPDVEAGGEDFEPLAEVVAEDKAGSLAVMLGQTEDELWQLAIFTQGESRATELELPAGFDPSAIDLLEDDVLIGGTDEDGVAGVYSVVFEEVDPCYNSGEVNTVFTLDGEIWVGSDEGVEACVSSEQLDGAPRGSVTVSGRFPSTPWLMLGGEEGIFVVDLNRVEAGFERVGQSAGLQDVVALSGRYAATAAGEVFRGTYAEGSWTWDLLTLGPELDTVDDLEIHDLELVQGRLLIASSKGLYAIHTAQNPLSEGKWRVPFPEREVRHITSSDGEGFFFSDGALLKLR